MDGQTGEWQADDSGTIDTYSIAVACQKIVYSIGLVINVREQNSRERKFNLWNFHSWEWKFLGTQILFTPFVAIIHGEVS